MKNTHDLKTDPKVFQDVINGNKTFEIRFNDRDFQVGDELILKETKYSGEQMKNGNSLEFTGRQLIKNVSYVLSGYGLQDGWVILGIVDESGQKSQQAKIDSLNKNIEALHVEIGRIQKEYQGMFEGVQGRQKTIDELQAKYDELNNRATGVALDQMATAKLNYELQARVDETLKILKVWDDQSYRDDMDQLIGEIEDILKGNKDEI